MAADSDDTWEKFTGGSSDALNALYRQYVVPLTNYGIRVTGNKAQSFECVTEMFLHLWERRNRLPEVPNVRSYLTTCMRNVIFQKLRNEKLREHKESTASALTPDFVRSYEEEITERQTSERMMTMLKTALSKLTPRQRELLSYRYFQDMSYDEIAKICNISKKTAYNIVFEAVKQLKNDVGAEFNGEMSLFSIVFLLVSLDFVVC